MVAPLRTALGDSPAVTLTAASTVAIAPGDDGATVCEENPGKYEVGTGSNAVNSNRVIITGSGEIDSFGVAFEGQCGEAGEPPTITKQIDFQPDPGQTITLHHNPPALTLLGGQDRKISARAFGTVTSDPDGNWTEESFSRSDVTPDLTRSGGLLSVIPYTASGPITIPPFATRAWLRMWGATGSSGPASATDPVTCSPGVGSGGYLESMLTGLTPGNTLTFTLGTGGAAPTYPNSGVKGGDSILASGTQVITTHTAHGSNGTSYGSSVAVGSFGGSATGGNIVNRSGQTGGQGGAAPGVGGAFGMSRGPDGSSNTTSGNPGNNGGLVIAWYNDPLPPPVVTPPITESWFALIPTQAPLSSGGGWADYQLRSRVKTSLYLANAPATGTKIRVTLTGGGTTTNSIKQAWVGHARSGSPTLDFDGNQVQLKFTGNANANLPTGPLASDIADFFFDKTKDLIISIWNGGSTVCYKTNAVADLVGGAAGWGSTPPIQGSNAGNDMAGFTGTPGQVYMVVLIEVFGPNARALTIAGQE
jgi:hypothetical protein